MVILLTYVMLNLKNYLPSGALGGSIVTLIKNSFTLQIKIIFCLIQLILNKCYPSFPKSEALFILLN